MASHPRPRGLAHRLLHTLVFGSVVALEGLGCGVSHEVPPPPPDPDAGGPDPDAGPRVEPDAGAPDAGEPDAGEPDAGAPDAGALDAGAVDAGPMDVLRACEEGWPTTKGFFCTTADAGVTLCCNSWDTPPTGCCIPEPE